MDSKKNLDPKKNPEPTNPDVKKTAPKKPLPKAAPQAGARPSGPAKAGVSAKPLPKAQPQARLSPQAAGQGQRPANRPVAQGQQGQNQPGQNQQGDEYDEALEGGGFGAWLKQAPSWLTSMVVHVAVLIVLAILTLPYVEQPRAELVMDEDPVVEQDDVVELPEKQIEDPKELKLDPTAMVEAPTALTQEAEPENPEIDDSLAAPADFDPLLDSDEKRFRSDILKGIGRSPGTATEGRSNQAVRGRLLREGGGTKESEAAVAAALKWLADHQLADGSWSFDHREGLCQGRCKNHGSLKDARLGSTGLALLPFLGAGNTHLTGQYKKNVHAGLYYLISHMNQQTGAMNDSGTMYSHGIAAIALCEAYAMTNDKATLGRAALASVDFITYAQDPVGGGWRYSPRTPGDTSVVGWQAMALLSAKMAYLRVDPKTFEGLSNFLNSVQVESGAKYGYTQPGAGPATTAIGLLCRMYMGWKRDNGALANGVQFLAQMGPSSNNMYYNYYSTQVLHHYGGEEWKAWNEKMREQLINTQDQEGHQKGSWHFNGGHGSDQGGRHYNTCMCAMTLEVYYRHLPIYKKQATEEEFEF